MSAFLQPTPRHPSVWVAPLEGWTKVNLKRLSQVLAPVLVLLLNLVTAPLPILRLCICCRAPRWLLKLEHSSWKLCLLLVMAGNSMFLSMMLKGVIDACCSIGVCHWEIRPIIIDIFCFALAFLSWDFMFVHREENVVAHSLVVFGLGRPMGESTSFLSLCFLVLCGLVYHFFVVHVLFVFN